MIFAHQCSDCKSPSLIDEGYQIVCTSCGLCDCTEPIPIGAHGLQQTIDGITSLFKAIDFSTEGNGLDKTTAPPSTKPSAGSRSREVVGIPSTSNLNHAQVGDTASGVHYLSENV